MTEAWRIALTEPQQERLAAAHLLRIGIPSYFPVFTKRTSTGRGRQRQVSHPLFPRYLFVKFSLDMPGWQRLFDTPGIRGCGHPLGRLHRLMMQGERYAEVPEAVIEAISLTEQRLAGERNPLAQRMNLKIGQECRMRLNAYTDVMVKIEDLTNDERIIVLFHLLGREVRAHVNVTQLAS